MREHDIQRQAIKQGRVDIQPVVNDTPLIAYILGLARIQGRLIATEATYQLTRPV